eukprot:CAMPEP_0198300624 /NCGR_PEP_ID=MMETSP1449-20131203/48896_1 /TAXON_ID=420275 /ORGANISM="Attheya septentrionalis, Strain CCMP2084" /LENGTH=70 /DNA_ID=CAMNT_0044002503 /DNA_START=44 /DNA_END=256 /DNA_ORIENTATION=-
MAVPRVSVAILGTKAPKSPVNRQSGSNERKAKHFSPKIVMDGTHPELHTGTGKRSAGVAGDGTTWGNKEV